MGPPWLLAGGSSSLAVGSCHMTSLIWQLASSESTGCDSDRERLWANKTEVIIFYNLVTGMASVTKSSSHSRG
jgi:hypothetical protein